MDKAVTAHPLWTDDDTMAWFRPWADRVADGGLNSLRFDVPYFHAKRDVRLGNMLSMLDTRGLKAIVSFAGSGPNWPKPDPEDYATAAADVARLLRPGDMLECWNEPNVTPNFWPPPASATEYAILLRLTYDAVKAQAPHVMVAAPNSAFNAIPFMKSVIEHAPDKFDVWNIHPYTDQHIASPDDPDTAHNGGGSFKGALQSCRDLLQSRGKYHFPLMIGEVGFDVPPLTAAQSASYYRTAVRYARDFGVTVFVAYSLGGHPQDEPKKAFFKPDGTFTRAWPAFCGA
jgi:hypothetical protein